MMATILIAEDDLNIQLLVSRKLKAYFKVICADDGAQAMEIIRSQSIDLLIADIEMPVMDGFSLLQNARDEGFQFPVIILTANQSFDAKRKGFSKGTDDFLTKPVNYEELVLRINALLRRANIAGSNKIIENGIVIDSSTYTVSKDDCSIELPAKEFDLLFKLLSYKGQIFTKNQLMDDIWGFMTESSEDTVKTHISRLRNRLKDFEEIKISAVRGIGYKADIEGGAEK